MHKRLSFFLVLTGLFLVLSGCGKSSPPSTYYILTSSSQQAEGINPMSNTSVGVGPVTIPGHLDRSQIVTSTGQNRITIHEYQRWGDSFETQVKETLAENISLLLKTPQVAVYPWERAQRPQYQVYLTIRRFEGKLQGKVTLDAIWQIVDVRTDNSMLTKQFVQVFPVTGNTMSAYVQAQSDALESLSKDIVQGLHTVARSR